MIFAFLFAAFDVRTEADLVDRLKRRDQDAMRDLYDRYGRVVYSVIFRVVKETGIAEDLAQETFLRVWNRVQFLDKDKGALGPWILAVARNRAIDHLRSLDARMAMKATDLEGPFEQPEAFQNLERDILKSDRARTLREAFAKLSPNQRQVIELAYYEGLSQSEMAERIHQPLGTIKTWVRTALKTLRNELEEVIST